MSKKKRIWKTSSIIRKYSENMASQITNHPSFQTVNIRQGTNDEEVIYVYYRISYIFLKSIGSYIVVQSEFGSLLKRNNSFMI